MYVCINPVRAVHVKYAFAHAMELLREHLTPVEQQVVSLHCGIGVGGRPMGFDALARLFSLGPASEAERTYLEAIVKLRSAIPGSRLENWVVCYRRAYHSSAQLELRVDPFMPVPVWDGRAPLPVK